MGEPKGGLCPFRAIKNPTNNMIFKEERTMIDACHQIILELQNPLLHAPLTVKRGDTGRKLQFLLTNHGAPYTITPECAAMFTAAKPDGNILYNACEIADNIITYTFTPQTCSVVGELPCELKLYGADDKLITTSRFTLIVEDAVLNPGDVVESATEVSALTALVSETSALLADVEQKLADNAFADAHSAVCFTPQSLPDTQKAQARENINAAPGFMGILTADDDMDALTADGVYVYSTASVPANAPFANASVVLCFGSSSTTSQRIQMAWRYGENGYFKFRVLFSTWKEWVDVFTSKCGSYDMIWQNASRTSSFAGQTIAVDTRPYDYLMVVCGYNTSLATSQSATHVWLRTIGTGDTSACLTVDYITSSGVVTRPFRPITVNSDRTKITIGGGCKNDGTSSDSNVIPYYIYGVKGVSNP